MCDEVSRGWGKLRNEERNLCSSPGIIRVMKSRRMGLAGHVTHMWKIRNAYRKREIERIFGRPGHKWEGNIDFKETGLEDPVLIPVSWKWDRSLKRFTVTHDSCCCKDIHRLITGVSSFSDIFHIYSALFIKPVSVKLILYSHVTECISIYLFKH